MVISLHHQIIVLSMIFQLAPFVVPLSFNFTAFNNDDNNITYEGIRATSTGAIKLTTTNADVARATYSRPMHLWDNTKGSFTDFTTHFSFVINSQDASVYGDGLAFFLAPAGSQIPRAVTKGCSLGLTTDYQELNKTANQFVAVEFDIYQNWWDPNGTHVGIDIDSMESVKYVSWMSSIMDGRKNDAWISYNSTSNNLTAIFTGFRNDTSTVFLQNNLYYQVDLSVYLPEWVTFGFSAAAGNQSAEIIIYSWSFSSTLDHIDKKNKSNLVLVIGLCVGGFVLVISGLGLVFFWFWKKRKSRRENVERFVFDKTMEEEFQSGTGPRRFSYKELAHWTSNFAEEEKLGEGGFGGVYRGFIRKLNSYVAVKRVSRGSKQGIKEYASEVKIISRLRHKNLVQLIGWCHEKRELLLVYEFMPNGSLDSHLFKPKRLLIWEVRYKIAQGLASALLYLHEDWEQCIVHRDIKSSNVMLDSNFNAKLGDFGLARLVDHGKASRTTVLAGTMGYMALECVATGKSSKESDVYSFGVVALEIACGRKPVQPKAPENQVMLVDWVWELYGEERILEAADSTLSGEFDEHQMERLMIVGLWCAHPDYKSRPSIKQVIHVLNFEAQLPNLPLKMPVATYSTPVRQSTVSVSSDATQSMGYSNNTSSSQYTGASASLSATVVSRVKQG